ncbi:MAG: acyloxyacyl hydrolase [Terracidiphilus sp.]|nr:acyloxyacyl hydrolase [Terracidiphilus sp.]
MTAAIVRIGCALLLGLLCLAQARRAGAQGAPTSGSIDSRAWGGRLAESVAPAATDDAAEPPVLSAMNAAAERPSRLAMGPPDAGAGQVKEIYLDRKVPVKQEMILEGMMSYGNYKIFASGYDEKLYTGGVEYDRHSWGRFLGSEMDYVAEILPFVLLDKPLKTNPYGSPSYPVNVNKGIREYVPGLGISPIGFRWQWRSGKKIRPYLEAKGGVLAFTKKVPATQATYVNFSLQSATGVQVMLNPKWGLRLGVFSDFHFSNAFIVASNPGLDVMNANLGLSYHF